MTNIGDTLFIRIIDLHSTVLFANGRSYNSKSDDSVVRRYVHQVLK